MTPCPFTRYRPIASSADAGFIVAADRYSTRRICQRKARQIPAFAGHQSIDAPAEADADAGLVGVDVDEADADAVGSAPGGEADADAAGPALSGDADADADADAAGAPLGPDEDADADAGVAGEDNADDGADASSSPPPPPHETSTMAIDRLAYRHRADMREFIANLLAGAVLRRRSSM